MRMGTTGLRCPLPLSMRNYSSWVALPFQCNEDVGQQRQAKRSAQRVRRRLVGRGTVRSLHCISHR